MKVMEKNVMRLVAVQHLRSVYGIKTKNWNKNKGVSCKTTTSTSTKVFGVSLENLPYYNMESGSVPSFLVDACMKLQAHVDTEGLFRKSGSVVRLKALRAKLDAGEECLSTALPCDIAGLVKQFFRELPEPVLPTELQEAFVKAQQLPTEEDRTPAIILLSCVLPDRNLSVLRHFFEFLYNVSQRSTENKMNSSNLSVILAPNLLHSGDGTEKMNNNTEKRLKLQAAVVQSFIENAFSFGVLPKFLQEKVPGMMGCEARGLSPTHDELVELDLNSGMKRRQRRSFGDVVSGALNKIKTNRTPTHTNQSDSLVFSSATPVIETPTSKRKLPMESGHSFGFSNKKRRSVKKTLGIDLLPNTLFSGVSTPGSAYSASGVLDSSQNAPSPAGRSRRQSVTSVRRKSQRLSKRHAVNRVESGKAGCFSPKVSKKDAPRKSLRLRFSLGKSSKEAGSESIGWRLATQDSTTSFCFTKETEFSPSVVLRNTECKKNKLISKSEDNLLTPQYTADTLRTSWCGETPAEVQALSGRSFSDTPMSMCLRKTHASEPAIVSKPPVVSSPMKLCCASSSQSLESESATAEPRSQTGSTPLKDEMAPTEPGGDLQTLARTSRSPSPPIAKGPSDNATILPDIPTTKVLAADSVVPSCPPKQGVLASEQNITFGQFEIAALSPLHIDSVIFESAVYCSPALKSDKRDGAGRAPAPVCPNRSFGGDGESETEQADCSRLIDALDIQSPARFKLGVASGLQSTPCKQGLALGTPLIGTTVDTVQEKDELSAAIDPRGRDQMAPCGPEAEQRHVAEHIQHFNKLTLHSPRGSGTKRIRSPLKFERTPVRQAVRRINSMLGESRRPPRSNQVVKAVSMESGLSPHPQLQAHRGALPARQNSGKKKPPPVPPKKPGTLAAKPRPPALGDMTNTVPTKTKVDSVPSETPGAVRPLAQQMAEKEMNHYRGSPWNPLNQARLLSATKPVDL